MVRQAYPTIAAVVLAAGRASRMGRPKQLLDWNGVPLVRRAAQAAIDAAGIGEVVVVIGAHRSDVEAALEGLNIRIVYNPDYEHGMSTSLKAGVRFLTQNPHISAAMIMVADQPLVDHIVLERLVETYRSAHPLIVAPIYGERRGNPVIFDRSLWSDLFEVSGDQGARDVIRKYHADAVFVHFGPEADFDIDTPEDYQRLRALKEQ